MKSFITLTDPLTNIIPSYFSFKEDTCIDTFLFSTYFLWDITLSTSLAEMKIVLGMSIISRTFE